MVSMRFQKRYNSTTLPFKQCYKSENWSPADRFTKGPFDCVLHEFVVAKLAAYGFIRFALTYIYLFDNKTN